ncbi:2-hydroxy-3-oxopropionate reductase [Rhodococcus wratislaviensis]|uniref:2-hydroxy-3-oxopropionate reductase n=1 Tax=Rhodococcus wratislaviensis TaxID=44752 RepID=A0A402CLG2_RHOWR|nr:2-hydroxy-3-oxopropionate reductase [Rhodococcus wratislaviensis]
MTSVSDDPATETVAFVGLGNMGAPMSRRLIDAGHRVIGFDMSDTAVERFADVGGVAAASAESAAAEADITILMLPSSDVVEAVLAGGLAAALRPGAVVVDMSSSEPMRTRALAHRLGDERGVKLIDAPVSGGVRGAVNGTLTVMVGGSDAAVGRTLPILEVLGRPTRVGEVGAGHALKALNNLLSATHLLVTSEAILAGQAFGLDADVMLSVINGSSGRSGSTENKWPNFILPQTYDSGFALSLMLKDMRIATDLARQLGLPSRLGEDAVSRWSEAAEVLAPAADHTEIARWVASIATPPGEIV